MEVSKIKKEAILRNTPPISQYTKRLGNVELETSLNIFTTWEISFQQLQLQVSADNLSAKLLTSFTFFDNTDVSEQLFAELDANEDRISESAKLLTWLKAFSKGTSQKSDSDLFARVLITLRDLSLLQGFAQEADGF